MKPGRPTRQEMANFMDSNSKQEEEQKNGWPIFVPQSTSQSQRFHQNDTDKQRG